MGAHISLRMPKRKKKASASVPPLSKSDLGTQGIKRLKATSSSAGIQPLKLTKEELKRREERMTRFNQSPIVEAKHAVDRPLASRRTTKESSKTSSSSDASLVGENQNLEKPYLRLTTFPKKEDVRPLTVLRRSLEHIKRTYLQCEDFQWANEQLKSVRQDLTVQRIREPFVLECYETHARILLENGDLNEFNQCQTIIRSLTSDKKEPLQQSKTSDDEFRGYFILYSLVQKSWGDLQQALIRAKPYLREPESNCHHAFSVWNAVTENNYIAFFRLYRDAPHMSAYLMDFLVKRVRDAAYKSIVGAFRPTIRVDKVEDWLNFANPKETRTFLKGRKAQFHGNDAPPTEIDCKSSSVTA